MTILSPHISFLEPSTLEAMEDVAFKLHKVEDTHARKAVFYTDGGYRMPSHIRVQPPAVGGYGLFGYTYVDAEPRRGHGTSGFTPTNCGLLNNDQVGKPFGENKLENHKVSVITYIEAFGAAFECKSNNAAEVEGIYAALKIIKQLGIREALIKTDSRYAQYGLWIKCPEWASKNWTKEGKPIPNVDVWKRVYELYTDVTATGAIVTCEWIKGHSDSKGNIEADRLAGTSMNVCVNGGGPEHVRFIEPAVAWNPKVDYHPMLTEPKMYLDSVDTGNRINDMSFYYMADPKKLDDDMFGKPSSDAMMAVVALRDPDPVLDKIHEAVSSFGLFNQKAVFISRLDLALRPNNYKQIAEYGLDWFRRNPHHNEIRLPDNTPIVRQMVSTNHGPSGMLEMRYLRDVLLQFMDKSLSTVPGVCITDVTDQIYREVTTKKKETVNEFIYDTADKTMTLGITWDDPSRGHSFIKLTLVEAVNIPRMRHFKHFTQLKDLKVYVVTEREGSAGFRHMTIISSESGIGIWSGVYSNLNIVLQS